ncbi:unnamed protein product [Gongylonema pulchrum]|uniref:Bestrophin homolog n=1 Tax=Gongylonema pulchrum TaxID=637853 RepID=A0A183ELL7_9BILA|nr:unnamed protein product [Gongylonema pulchrum]
MMEHEKEKYDEIQYRYAKYWMPFQWALSLCQEARNQQKISSDFLLEKVGEEIKIFRTNMAILCNFDWVPLPIMYPQLIVLAVHTYFLVAAVARQFIISEEALNKTPTDIYFPFMTVVQFVFYMGWLKVAEAMLNPFGEDDDDFECNFLLDKNLTIGLTIVDAGYNKTPALLKDVFWSEKQIEPLYSAQSAREEHRISGVTGSTANVKFEEKDGLIKMQPLSEEAENRHLLSGPFGILRSSLRFSSRGERSMSHSYFNTSLHHGDSNRKNDSANELSGMERGYSKGENDGESRRNSLSRVLEAIVSESNSYSNPAIVVTGSCSNFERGRKIVFQKIYSAFSNTRASGTNNQKILVKQLKK